MDANKDVKTAIENGDFPNVEIYLEQFGLKRIQNGSSRFHHDYKAFDETEYLKEFPEVKEAVEEGVFTSGFEHFCLFGYAEILGGSRFWERSIENTDGSDSIEIQTIGPSTQTDENELWDDTVELLTDTEHTNDQNSMENTLVDNVTAMKGQHNDVYPFIPFTVSSLPKGPALVFAPHPDDETFGLGGTILKMTDKGQIVTVVMMTDGAAGGDEEVRKEELRKATQILGVSECHFFGAPDQGLVQSTANIYKIIQLVKKYRPANIFFPSPLEYHPDHRTTAWLVWNALQSIAYRGNVFSYEVANQSPANTLIDITSSMQKKTEAMKHYGSQQEQLDYITTVTSMNQLRTYTLPENVHYAEAFYRFDDLDSDLMSYYYAHFHKYHNTCYSQKLPLVSVLVRTKNRPEQLANALRSIQMQYYQNLEVNIVNDGGEKIESVVEPFDFERCFIRNNPESKGRAGAANDLLKMVNGQYAIFLDDDDTFDSNHINDLLKILLKNEGLLAAYSAVRIGEKLHNRKLYNHPYSAAILRRGNYIPFHAVLFSAKLIEMGCSFDESLEIYEDWDFWLQVAQHTDFYYLNKVGATYHVCGTSGAGGAGSNALNDTDLTRCKWKIYEKWSKIWTPQQLDETFNAPR